MILKPPETAASFLVDDTRDTGRADDLSFVDNGPLTSMAAFRVAGRT